MNVVSVSPLDFEPACQCGPARLSSLMCAGVHAWQEHGGSLRSAGSPSSVRGSVKENVLHFFKKKPLPYIFPRKLKNRVAAQTARDRKKAKMGELEQQVLELELEVNCPPQTGV